MLSSNSFLYRITPDINKNALENNYPATNDKNLIPNYVIPEKVFAENILSGLILIFSILIITSKAMTYRSNVIVIP